MLREAIATSFDILDKLREKLSLQDILQALPAAIYTTDASGRITFYNEACVTLSGRRPQLGSDQWCVTWRLYTPDGALLPHEECPMALSLKQKTPIRGVEAVAERPDGTRVSFMPYPTPLFDSAGRLIGAVNMLVELEDSKRAKEASQRLVGIVESSFDAIISKDLSGYISSWNRGAERLFGYTADEIVSKHVTVLIPIEHKHEEAGILRRIERGERIEPYETVRQRKDGSLVDVSLTISPIRDAKGKIIGASKIARDISDRRRLDQTKDLLLDEMKHRIKNTLTTVQAIALQTMRSATLDETTSFGERLQALGRAHDLLSDHADWQRAKIADVIARALKPFQDRLYDRISVTGDNTVSLEADNSLLLTMVLHELATNAVKYGSLSNDLGKVCVRWERLDGAMLKLCWRERGGPAPRPPEKKGFGTQLIGRAFGSNGHGAEFEFSPEGLTCVLQIDSRIEETRGHD
jgi:PAS domain S-box-containing protein